MPLLAQPPSLALAEQTKTEHIPTQTVAQAQCNLKFKFIESEAFQVFLLTPSSNLNFNLKLT